MRPLSAAPFAAGAGSSTAPHAEEGRHEGAASSSAGRRGEPIRIGVTVDVAPSLLQVHLRLGVYGAVSDASVFLAVEFLLRVTTSTDSGSWRGVSCALLRCSDTASTSNASMSRALRPALCPRHARRCCALRAHICGMVRKPTNPRPHVSLTLAPASCRSSSLGRMVFL